MRKISTVPELVEIWFNELNNYITGINRNPNFASGYYTQLPTKSDIINEW